MPDVTAQQRAADTLAADLTEYLYEHVWGEHVLTVGVSHVYHVADTDYLHDDRLPWLILLRHENGRLFEVEIEATVSPHTPPAGSNSPVVGPGQLTIDGAVPA
jgi:hypothetical protein